MTVVLAEYDEEVIRRVTDPREGVARTLKWMPTIAEVSEACDAAKRAIAAENYFLSKGMVWVEGKGWIKTA